MATYIIQSSDLGGGRKYEEEYKDIFRLLLTGDMFITTVEKSGGAYFFKI